MIPRFVADVMLGSLSRWLRLFGFDTLYRNDFRDKELIKISLQEDRILLTKDTALSKSRILKKVLFIKSDSVDGQLLEVLSFLKKNNYDISNLMPRCPVCNGLIELTEKEFLKGEIPDYVYVNFNDFYVCNSCGKVYWRGTHRERIDSVRERILKIFEKSAEGNGQ